MATQCELDEKAQLEVFRSLKLSSDCMVEHQEMRLKLPSGDVPIHMCVNVKLDSDFTLTCSIRGGTINATVGDSTVQLIRKSWRRTHLHSAIGWMLGYIDGYLQ